MKTLPHLRDGQIRQFILTSQTEKEIGKIVKIIRRRCGNSYRTTELSAVSIQTQKRICVLNRCVDRQIFVADFQTVLAERKSVTQTQIIIGRSLKLRIR